MSLISDYLSKNLTSLTKEQLSGAKKIITGCFNNYTSLRSIGIPYSVKKICINAFEGCLNLTEIDSSSMDPFCWLPVNLGIDNPIMATGWYSNAPVNSMITLANGQILVGNKITTPGSGFVIPNTVKNIAGGACKRYGSAVDSSFTNVIIPDTVEIVGDEIFYNQTALTKITVGSSVKKYSVLSRPEQV